MRNEHTWREKTEDGDRRDVRATRFGGRWKLQSKVGKEPWVYYDVPLLADLHTLRELLWRKYQRRRATYEDVLSIDKLITLHTNQQAQGMKPS